jgi:Uma2 family endonuclease
MHSGAEMFEQLTGVPMKLTYEDYCALPDDGKRYEILDGDLYVSPSPMIPHQRAAAELLRILADHVEARDLGEVFVAPCDVILGEHNIVVPDLLFVSNERKSIVTEKNIKGAPDLLIEILSPSTQLRDIRDKRNIYARCGVEWYWIVDAREPSILELQRTESEFADITRVKEKELFRPALFPGLEFAPSDLIE